MQFSQIPPQNAPLGEPLNYTVICDQPAIIDICIYANGTLLAARRFAGKTQATIDAAPCLRRVVRFAHPTGGTGFYPATARTLTVEVEASANLNQISAPSRTFIAAESLPEAPALLSAVPRERVIGPGESDELTLLTTAPCTITVTALGDESTIAQSYHSQTAGLHLFRLDARDFPDARSFILDAGACGKVEYVVDAAPGVRLAWRSGVGSVEHYTFPIEEIVTIDVAREHGYGPEGYVAAVTATERRTRLRSAFETRPMLEALTEILVAPEVWTVSEQGYELVDVVSPTVTPHRRGTVGYIEVEIRPKLKTRSLWN